MADDFTQKQEAGGKAHELARARSLQQRRAPGQAPPYDLVRCLGQGAYGEVWLATQQSNRDRRVAVKFYMRGGDWSSLAREVQKLNILTTDRYIIQILDVGWAADAPYYVMEHLEDGPLAQRLESGPWAVAEAVGLHELLQRVSPQDQVAGFLNGYTAQRHGVAPPDWNGVIVLTSKG
jgi:serine/threonine protein kinase